MGNWLGEVEVRDGQWLALVRWEAGAFKVGVRDLDRVDSGATVCAAAPGGEPRALCGTAGRVPNLASRALGGACSGGPRTSGRRTGIRCCWRRRSSTRHAGGSTASRGINGYDSLLSNPVLGKSWEGFVIENIHSVLPSHSETYFYRTVAGAEIDLVIKMPSSEIWAIEIRCGIAPKLGKHYSKTCDDVGARYKYILYGGEAATRHRTSVPLRSVRRIASGAA